MAGANMKKLRGLDERKHDLDWKVFELWWIAEQKQKNVGGFLARKVRRSVVDRYAAGLTRGQIGSEMLAQDPTASGGVWLTGRRKQRRKAWAARVWAKGAEGVWR